LGELADDLPDFFVVIHLFPLFECFIVYQVMAN
jgi:hypothetical protein